MRFSSKQSLFFVQSLVLLLALVAVDAGSAVQMPLPQVAAATEAASVTEGKVKKIRSHRCAVWASCNGQQQTVRVDHKKALLLAVAVGLNQGS